MGALSDAAGLLDDKPAAPAASTSGEKPYFGTIPADVQASRDDRRLRMLFAERDAQAKEGRVDPALEKEIGFAQGRKPASSAPAASPAPTPSPARPSLMGSAIDALDDGGKVVPPKPTPAEQSFAGRVGEAVGKTVDYALAPTQAATNMVSGIGGAIMGGWRGLAAIASGAGLEEAARQVHAPELAGGQTAQAYQPAEGTPGATLVAGVEHPANPMNWPGIAADVAGGAVAGGASRLGASPEVAAGAGTLVNTAINAAPLVLLKGGKGAAEPKLVGSGSAVPEAVRLAEIATPAERLDVPTYLRRGINPEAVPVKVDPAVAGRPPLALAPQERGPVRSVPDAFEKPAPPAEVKPLVFAESASPAEVGKKLPAAEQASRAETLRAVGVDDVRKSAIEGDAKAAATDFQTSRLDNPAGALMKSTLDNERQALTNHAENIVRDTGGTLGSDAATLETRGHAVLSPLEGFKQWFTDKTTGLYNEARARAQGQPVELATFKDILATDSKFANTDTIELRKGINARMRELKMVDKDGNLLPATVDQAENLRKYVNEEWSPKSNGRIRELKEALDADVTGAAGEDVYGKARALHAMKQTIFADPKGLSSILDSEGINRKVPIEKVADTIASLPNAQFEHIVKTLKTVPPELQPQAQAALAEIKAHFANKVLEAGGKGGDFAQWRARDVTAVLNKNAAKLPMIFEPAELAKLKSLNDAGHILAKDASYPGAAVQEHNLVRRGAMGALRSGAAATGAFIGGPIGAAIGDMVGAGVAGKMNEAASLKATQKRVVKLSDFPK